MPWPAPRASAPGVGTMVGPPSMPIICADTPTQMWPWRLISFPMYVQAGAASRPLLTLSHSTTTVPSKRVADVGRRTTMRVAYGAFVVGDKVNRPSGGIDPEYAVAVPEA